MKCLICNGDDIHVEEVREEIRVEKDIVRIPVQTPVCKTCGERYYDRRTVRYLEEMAQKLQSGQIDLQQVGKVLVPTG